MLHQPQWTLVAFEGQEGEIQWHFAHDSQSDYRNHYLDLLVLQKHSTIMCLLSS